MQESFRIPSLALPSSSGKTIVLDQIKQKYILYFYPKDNTPGCTLEAQNFRDFFPQLTSLGFLLYGISRDTITSHQKFIEKFSLPFELLSDQEQLACQAFDTLKTKNLYGKQVQGIERSTFIINKAGMVVACWRKVKVPDHVQTLIHYITTTPID